MKNLLSIILSFVAGCLIVLSIYNYKEKIVLEKKIIINESDTIKTSIDNVHNSILTVLGYTSIDDASTIGSSFVYKIDDEYAYILTNYHVVEGLSKIKVQNMEENLVDATIVGFDKYNDIAILKADKSICLQVATFADSSYINLGDTVFTVGSPLSMEYYGSVSKGIISYKNRLISTLVDDKETFIDTIQIDAAINLGNSGGPLLNIKGEVIGIVVSKIMESNVEGMSFAIPINKVKDSLEILEKGESVSRVETNFESVDLNNDYDLYKNELYLDEEYEYGIYIKKMNSNSIFKNVLKENDIILKINDKNIKNIAHFEYFINKFDNINLEIKRDKEIFNFDFTH